MLGNCEPAEPGDFLRDRTADAQHGRSSRDHPSRQRALQRGPAEAHSPRAGSERGQGTESVSLGLSGGSDWHHDPARPLLIPRGLDHGHDGGARCCGQSVYAENVSYLMDVPVLARLRKTKFIQVFGKRLLQLHQPLTDFGWFDHNRWSERVPEVTSQGLAAINGFAQKSAKRLDGHPVRHAVRTREQVSGHEQSGPTRPAIFVDLLRRNRSHHNRVSHVPDNTGQRAHIAGAGRLLTNRRTAPLVPPGVTLSRRSGAVQLGAIPCGSLASELQSPLARPPDYDESSARRDHQVSAAVSALSASRMPSPTSPAVAAQCRGTRARAPGSHRYSSRVNGSGAVLS